jgi:hypothetical protein
MRILSLNLLAVALLLFGATSASAYGVQFGARQGGDLVQTLSSLTVGTNETFVVDVFFDNIGGDPIVAFSFGVVYDNPGLTYDKGASEALAAQGAAGGGAQPSYILYTPGAGTVGSSILYPIVTPSFNTWVAPDPGTNQVNIDFFEPTFGSAPGTGSNTWIASLVFHVEPGYLGGVITLCATCGGNALGVTIAGANVDEAALGNVILGAPITLVTHVVPEPTTAALIGLGVLGLAVAGRRR